MNENEFTHTHPILILKVLPGKLVSNYNHQRARWSHETSSFRNHAVNVMSQTHY